MTNKQDETNTSLAKKSRKSRATGNMGTPVLHPTSYAEVSRIHRSALSTLKGSMVITSTFSDYKEVNGIKFAHKIAQNFGPQALDMEVLSIEFNTKVSDDTFE